MNTNSQPKVKRSVDEVLEEFTTVRTFMQQAFEYDGIGEMMNWLDHEDVHYGMLADTDPSEETNAEVRSLFKSSIERRLHMLATELSRLIADDVDSAFRREERG